MSGAALTAAAATVVVGTGVVVAALVAAASASPRAGLGVFLDLLLAAGLLRLAVADTWDAIAAAAALVAVRKLAVFALQRGATSTPTWARPRRLGAGARR